MTKLTVFSDYEDRNLTLEKKRNRALEKLESPATTLVPMSEVDIKYSDWLLEPLTMNEDFATLVFGITSMLATIALFTLIPTTLASDGLSSSIGFPIIGVLGAYICAALYGLGLVHGDSLSANPVAALIYDRRIRKVYRRQMKKASRQARQLDAVGWRPRQGIPHPQGRNDIYDRWLVEAHTTDLGVVVGLRHWVCGEQRIWQPEEIIADRWFEDTPESVALIGEYRAVLQDEIKTLENEALLKDSEKQASLEADGRSNKTLVQHINETSAAEA